MNLRETLSVLAPAATQATRGDRQRIIEEAIARFAPDAVEARELLDALQAGLKDRYDESQLTDTLHEFDQAREALDELERTTSEQGEEDLAYANWQATQAAQYDEEEQHG
jgi:hypothetical protein